MDGLARRDQFAILDQPVEQEKQASKQVKGEKQQMITHRKDRERKRWSGRIGG